MRVASFDLLPVDEYLSEKIKMTPRDPINCAFEAIGFETMYTLMNLGTMLIILMLFPALALIEVFLKIIKCSCSQKMRQKLRNSLYWNTSITLYKECYLMAIMCAFINLKTFTFITIGELISSGLSVLVLALGVIVPGFLIVSLRRNYPELNNKDIEKKFGAAYNDLRLEK